MPTKKPRKTTELDALRQEIEAIKTRNKRVELDKAWETSLFRKVLLAVMTYIVAVLFMYAVGADKPWFNALMPSLGFIISTQSLPYIKKWWVGQQLR